MGLCCCFGLWTTLTCVLEAAATVALCFGPETASEALGASSASPLLLLLPFPVMPLCRNQLQVDVVLSPAVVWTGVKEIIAQIAAHLLFPMARSLPAAELTCSECCVFWGAGGTAVPCFRLWDLGWPQGLQSGPVGCL